MNNNRNYQKESKTQYITNQNYEYTRLIIGENVNQPLDIRGIWDSNYGRMVFNQDGNKVTGYYEWDDGFFNGKMDQNILSGNWQSKATYMPPVDAGRFLFTFNTDDFIGKWGYGNKSLYYRWDGKKISNLLLGNCTRYKVSHNASDILTIIVNGENIKYGQQSSYFYPEKCLPYTELKLIIDGEIFLEIIPVEPGYSYTFSIENKLPDLKIEVIVDNPFS